MFRVNRENVNLTEENKASVPCGLEKTLVVTKQNEYLCLRA